MPKKGGLEQFAGLRGGGLAGKRGGGVFEGGGVDTPMQTAGVGLLMLLGINSQ